MTKTMLVVLFTLSALVTPAAFAELNLGAQPITGEHHGNDLHFRVPSCPQAQLSTVKIKWPGNRNGVSVRLSYFVLKFKNGDETTISLRKPYFYAGHPKTRIVTMAPLKISCSDVETIVLHGYALSRTEFDQDPMVGLSID